MMALDVGEIAEELLLQHSDRWSEHSLLFTPRFSKYVDLLGW
jgi:hypothetical protein